MPFLLRDSPQKLTLEKIQDFLIIPFDVSPLFVLFNYKEFVFLLKKTTNLQQVTDRNTPNLVLKRMLGHFLKIPQLKKIFEFSICKKDFKINLRPKIKLMIENFQTEFYQLETSKRC